MLFVLIPLKSLVISIIVILLIGTILYIYIRNNKIKNQFIAKIVYLLMKEKMKNIQYNKKTNLYNISFSYNDRNYYIKIYKGGPKKGFIMTNPTTIYATTYSSQYGPSKKSERATSLTPFLQKSLNGLKIILIQKNMLRITKYINENEIEEVKYNSPSFNTFIIQENDFSKFIEFIKNKK